MWGASDGKHEANTRAVYDAVVLIAGDISDKCRKYLFDKIQSIPLNEYTDITIDLIERFALSVFESKEINYLYDTDDEDEMQTQKVEDSIIKEPSYYGTKLLWSILQDSSVLSSELCILSLNALKKLLN